MGVFKVNVDETTLEADNAIGVGVIIRDRFGRFVAAKSERIAGPPDATEAEVIDAQEGLGFVRDLGYIWIGGKKRSRIK